MRKESKRIGEQNEGGGIKEYERRKMKSKGLKNVWRGRER